MISLNGEQVPVAREEREEIDRSIRNGELPLAAEPRDEKSIRMVIINLVTSVIRAFRLHVVSYVLHDFLLHYAYSMGNKPRAAH